ncbi:MAG TPA: UDP-N-acetylmuramoyl-tripeptide--D-alanyl-D-alanine ligase [Acidobacteriaceae bacterium]|nr:UDP-N-acetylmuramoyl-tripeptide--D-alanyl-D-alanine ligase [Acidobacteriaceae bacterium]
MKLTLAHVARAVAAEPIAGGEALTATGYSIDSRTVQPGNLFFAIRGERFDGHDFVTAALERGARAAVVARSRLASLPEAARQHPLLAVDDPLAALQRLAASVRRQWGKRVVGITGSAGKTTTKEAVAAALGARFTVLKSQGNLNNGFGLPLQLLRLEPEHDVAVIEMGMSASGEIAALCRMAAPDWGVVTNVGHAHAEFFSDGVAGIARAKFELVAALPRQGVAFLNCDDAYVSQFGRGFEGKVVYFGRGPCAGPRADTLETLGAHGIRMKVRAIAPSRPGGSDPNLAQSCDLHLHLPGEHNVSNALAAIAVGVEAGIPLAECCRALEELRAEGKRGEVLTLRGATVIDDTYNSNPEALRSMIGTLAQTPARRRILVAGEMLELGPEAAALHGACGKEASLAGIDVVLGVRGNARHLVDAAAKWGVEALFVETPEEAGAWLRDHLRAGDAVLLKGSRGVRLERALAMIAEAEKDGDSAQPGNIR